MLKKVLFFIIFLPFLMNGQELNCSVEINAEQTGQSNLQVFRTLRTAVEEFMNTTSWTNAQYKQQEKIDCNIVLIINTISSDYFTGSIQVQSSRPVYNSTYNTTIFNFNDRQLSFRYTEFQPMNYNANTFDNNLISTLAFYAYTVIGMDAASFENGGGKPYFEEAAQIVNTASQGNGEGWTPQSGAQSRYRLNRDLLSPNFEGFNSILYAYHRNGLDFMAENPKEAKQSLAVTIGLFNELYNNRPNNFLTRVFFDAKADEVVSIFSGGPQVNVANLTSTLNKVAPTKGSYWRKIKL